jgi:hypothetical protein
VAINLGFFFSPTSILFPLGMLQVGNMTRSAGKLLVTEFMVEELWIAKGA